MKLNKMKPISYQPYLNLFCSPWVEIRDGNPLALDLFSRHYSKYIYKDGRTPNRFVGPGQRMVLISTCGRALFVWRKFISMDGQQGVNCSVFRNESEQRSSYLIDEAVKLAQIRWPNERLYTYVNASKIKSKNPGYCFKVCGWKFVGLTKARKLHILEYKRGMTLSNTNKMDFNNQSGLDFTDISSEEFREYTLSNGQKVRIENPQRLNVSESGGHRLFDGEGLSHYVPTGWVWLTWKAKDGQAHFVK